MGRLALGSVSVVFLLAVMLVLLPKFRNEAEEIFEGDEDLISKERSNPSPPPAAASTPRSSRAPPYSSPSAP